MNKYFNIDCVYLMLQYSVKLQSTETDLCTDKRLCTSAVDLWRDQGHSRVEPVHNGSGFKGDVNRLQKDGAEHLLQSFSFQTCFTRRFLFSLRAPLEKNGYESGLIMRSYQKCVTAAEDREILAATTVTAVHTAVRNTQEETGRARVQAPRRCF